MASQENKENKNTPVEYDLLLADGITGVNIPKYWRSEDNTVGISGTISFNGIPTESKEIAILPEGFRPMTPKNFLLAMAVSPHVALSGWIFIDGKMELSPSTLSEDVKKACSFAFIVPPFCVA